MATSKSRSLPLTELANQYGQSEDSQRHFLKRFLKPPGKISSYDLAKNCIPEAVGATGPLFPTFPGISGGALWEYVTARAKGNCGNRDFNWPIVEALSRWSKSKDGLVARHRAFDAVPLIGTHRARLVGDVLLSDGGPPAMVCIDPRKANGLTERGIFVVQSLIHHLLREQHLDLAECDIWVVQFPLASSYLLSPIDGKQTKLVSRNILICRLGDIQPIGWSELVAGIGTTLAIFSEMAAEATAERRRGSGGSPSP